MSTQNRLTTPDFDTIWPKIQEPAGDLAQRTEWMSRRSGKSALLMIPTVITGILFLIALFGFLIGARMISVIAFILALVFAAPP